MSKASEVEAGGTAPYTVLKLPLLLGSLPLTMLPFLLPLYAKQLGATALGIGGLFAVAQGMMVLCRPVIGWGVDRWGRRGFCLVGLGGAAGAMGVCAVAGTLTTLYLAQLLNGLATACTWTAVYTLTSDLAPRPPTGKPWGVSMNMRIVAASTAWEVAAGASTAVTPAPQTPVAPAAMACCGSPSIKSP